MSYSVLHESGSYWRLLLYSAEVTLRPGSPEEVPHKPWFTLKLFNFLLTQNTVYPAELQL